MKNVARVFNDSVHDAIFWARHHVQFCDWMRVCLFAGGRGIGGAHGPQSAKPFYSTRVQQDGRAKDAALRAHAVCWQTFQQLRDGPESHLATRDQSQQLFLCRCACAFPRNSVLLVTFPRPLQCGRFRVADPSRLSVHRTRRKHPKSGRAARRQLQSGGRYTGDAVSNL